MNLNAKAVLRILSFRPPVCLSCTGSNLKTKVCRKTQIDVSVTQGKGNWRVHFRSKRWKIKVNGQQKSPENGAYLATCGWPNARRRPLQTGRSAVGADGRIRVVTRRGEISACLYSRRQCVYAL